jgi:2-methylcitrate dehydratase PrpD
MEIHMKDGAVYSSQVDYAKGSRENPMTDEERKDKFHSLASGILSSKKRAAVISMVEQLEEVGAMSELCRLLY